MKDLTHRIAYLLSRHRFVSNDVGIVQADRDYARETIRLVLSAVRDGLRIPSEARRTWLDEALGLVGRSEPMKAHQALKVLLFNTVDVDAEDDVILVALCKEEQP